MSYLHPSLPQYPPIYTLLYLHPSFKMFTPLNVKKLTNVSVVTLKKYGKRYELALYPNKLYEYQKGITTNLEEIVQHQTIFKNISKGEVCSKEDLGLFKKPIGDIIREILEKGHEQKNEATRGRETLMAEREIVDIVRWKVQKNGRFLNQEAIREAILKIHKVQPGNVKKQAQEVVGKLEREGFERISFKIEVEKEKVEGFKGIEFKEGVESMSSTGVKSMSNSLKSIGFVNSLDFPKFRKYCEERSIPFVITKTEEEEEEEIN